jgi:hypothetical protein
VCLVTSTPDSELFRCATQSSKGRLQSAPIHIGPLWRSCFASCLCRMSSNSHPKYMRQFAFLDVLFVLLHASTLVLPVFIKYQSSSTLLPSFISGAQLPNWIYFRLKLVLKSCGFGICPHKISTQTTRASQAHSS